MNIQKQIGSCFCNNIMFEIFLNNSLESYNPRECSCDFCQKHGAAYLSDNKGQLKINIKDANNLNIFRQGSNLAEFLICKICGVLVAVYYKENDINFAAINFRVLNNKELLANSVKIFPEKLSANEKVNRWKEVWFNEVDIIVENK